VPGALLVVQRQAARLVYAIFEGSLDQSDRATEGSIAARPVEVIAAGGG